MNKPNDAKCAFSMILRSRSSQIRIVYILASLSFHFWIKEWKSSSFLFESTVCLDIFLSSVPLSYGLNRAPLEIDWFINLTYSLNAHNALCAWHCPRCWGHSSTVRKQNSPHVNLMYRQLCDFSKVIQQMGAETGDVSQGLWALECPFEYDQL